MKYVVPDMVQSFGTLEFAGESEPVFERDKNNRRVLARRSYNLYSDVQKGENVVVEIPVQAGEKKFKYEQKGVVQVQMRSQIRLILLSILIRMKKIQMVLQKIKETTY